MLDAAAVASQSTRGAINQGICCCCACCASVQAPFDTPWPHVQAPLTAPSHPILLQLRGEDFDGALLQPWLDAHTAAVTALAASTGGRGPRSKT